MKKLMTALLCALGFSLVTQAERINGTNFEDLDFGPNAIGANETGGTFWYGSTANVVDAIVTNYVGEYKRDYPSIHTNSETNAKMLYINTKGEELIRSNSTQNVEIGNGIYFDSMVQFTATDTLTATNGEDKLIVWLRESVESVDENTKVTNVNLVVTAGYLNGQYAVETKDYVVLNPVQADKWYRLTIQAITNAIHVGESKNYVGYAIFIDGVKAEYSTDIAAFDNARKYEVSSPYDNYLYKENKHALYPSRMNWDATGVDTFKAVAFSGVGAVDDIEFNRYNRADAPEFLLPPASLTVEWDVGVNTVTITPDEGEAIVIAANGVAGSTNITDKGTYTIAATVQTGYVAATVSPAKVTVANTEVKVKVSTEEGYAEINGTLYASLTNAVKAAQNGDTVKLYKGEDLGSATFVINNQNAFVLDLNGQVLSGSNRDGVLSVGNDYLTIIDSIGGGAVSNTTAEAEAEAVAVIVDGGKLVIGLAENDMGASFFGRVGAANGEPLSIVLGNFYSDDEESLGEYVAQGRIGNMVENCYVVGPVTFGLNPAVVELYYNCTSQISVVGAPEGATFYWQEEVIPGQSTGSGSISFSGDIKPLSVSSGRKTDTLKFYSNTTNGTWHLTAYVTNDNVQVAQFVANVVVKDVAAVVGGVEYTKAQLADAVADAIANDEVLGLYVDGPAVTLAAGQQIKVTALADKNKDKIGKLTVSGPVGTDGAVYVVQNTITDGVRTYSLTPEDPSVMFVSADGVTTNYFDASFKAAAAGTYKLLKNITRNQLSVGTAGVVLDLNGKTFTSTATGSTAAILVTSTIGTAGLTIVDSSDAGTGAIVAPNYSVLQSGKNGTVAVEGGSLSGKTVIVYTLSGGTAAISGGKFQMVSGSADSMLNCKDDNKGTISVTGGAFYGFDPANNNADGAGTDYVTEGYVSTADKPESGWYTVEEDAVSPTVDGDKVDADKVFDNATSASVIVYPTEPTKTQNQDGTTTVTFNNQSSTVPAYYDVTITQTQEATTYTVALKLNNNALPEIDEAVIAEETKPAMEVTDNATTVTLKATNPKLYYGLATADAPNANFTDPEPTTLTKGNGGAMQITIPVGSNETSKFYRVYVTDIVPPQSGN